MSDFNPPLPPYPAAPALPTPGPAFPMTFGQILDRIFRLVRGNLRPFLFIAILVIGVVVAFEALFLGALFLAGIIPKLTGHPNPTALLWTVVPFYLLLIPVLFVVYGLYYGASTYAALMADHDAKFSTGEAFRHAWSKLGRYIWLYVLRSLIIVVPILVVALAFAVGGLLLGLIPMSSTANNGGNPNPAVLLLLIPLGILFYICAFVYAIIMSLRYSLAFPACVHENITAVQALKRSGRLTNGAKGRIFLIFLILYAIGSAVGMVVYAVVLVLIAVGAIAGVGNFHAHLALTITLGAIAGLVVLVLVFVWSALLMAAYSIAFAVFYRDQCLRKDGLLAAPAL